MTLKEIIDQLFWGWAQTSDRRSKEYRQLNKNYNTALEKIERILSPKNQKVFDEFTEIEAELQSITESEAYEKGFMDAMAIFQKNTYKINASQYEQVGMAFIDEVAAALMARLITDTQQEEAIKQAG
ncbi:MAG TPA: hypothetical protein PKA10_19815 [Selenomonadales bacterium]|nr:hypothetical protein [Selenomonadales bacterium]